MPCVCCEGGGATAKEFARVQRHMHGVCAAVLLLLQTAHCGSRGPAMGHSSSVFCFLPSRGCGGGGWGGGATVVAPHVRVVQACHVMSCRVRDGKRRSQLMPLRRITAFLKTGCILQVADLRVWSSSTSCSSHAAFSLLWPFWCLAQEKSRGMLWNGELCGVR